ncbi:MAG: ATP-binding protein, partial [Desulfoprunum sp.]|nr:ATP-binding protein [Desulfoprunum sp.]
MDDPGKELDVLRATIAVLEEENSQLSERAEDAMLLGLVAAAIQGLDNPVEIIGQVLERISILKDLHFVTCGRLVGGNLVRIQSYAAFSAQDSVGYPITLGPDLCRELRQGPFVSHSLDGLSTTLSSEVFAPSSVLLIPFNCHIVADGLFLFFDREGSPDRLASMLFLLDQIVHMTVARLDNLFLTRELAALNAGLEDRVLEKTEALRMSNKQLLEVYERFGAVLDGVDSPINVTDISTYEIVYVNRKSKEVFPAAIEGLRCYKAIRNEDAPCEHCMIPRLLETMDKPDHVLIQESYNPITGRWYLNREKMVPWPGISMAKMTIATDITEMKKAEEEKQKMQQNLQQAQKMEAVGILAGGVAHDLNNILSGIVSYPDLLLANLPVDSNMRKPLETMQTAGRKAAAIVRDLLTLARRGIKIEETVDLGHLVGEFFESAEYAALLRRQDTIDIVAPTVTGPFWVSGSSVHLSNSLMNIVTNAAEAMPDGGTISIGLDQIALTSQPPGFLAWRKGDYVRLTVSDNGIGIPEKFQEQIFDPFFSRKKLGRSGTGLGLAIVWGTVVDHKGFITVDSTEGQGTTFQIYLPLQGGLAEQRPGGQAKEPLRGHGQSVLVVDDIENQRQIASEILTHLGYAVTSVDSGEAAIRRLRECPFDLIMLDMIMPPGIDG